MQKVIVVTGGTYGIGRAITITLAKKGYRVLAFGLEQRQIGSNAAGGIAGTRSALNAENLDADLMEADVSDSSQVNSVIGYAFEKYGRIDALVNNAAIHPSGNILETPEDVWDKVLDVNLKGMFLSCQAVIPHMIEQGGGAIVNIGSGSGWGKPNLLAYCASKGGVYALSMALAYDHLHDHIRVNMVIPGGGVITGMNEGTARVQYSGKNTVTGTNTETFDIANAVAFLTSQEAHQISGTIIDVGCFSLQGGPIPSPRN
jgi:NAD(P)-dependent dehydrogenase (short-subunit alcohol dehydrogenase family)